MKISHKKIFQKLSEESYKTFKDSLDSLEEDIVGVIDDVESLNNLNELTISKLDKIISRISLLQSRMDKSINDFYHILGMTSLNSAKVMSITIKFRNVLRQRDDLKFSLSHVQKLKGLVEVCSPNSRMACYAISELGDMKIKVKSK